MKLISWNVNGLRACMGKGFETFFDKEQADFFCLQETKLQAGQIDFAPSGYQCYWNYAQKKGYSGTAIFAKHAPLSVRYGIGVEELDKKLNEEIAEYQADKSIEEMAEVLEVLLAICEARGHSTEELMAVREAKREKRGGFDKKILLKKVIEE
jgi:exonuclease III